MILIIKQLLFFAHFFVRGYIRTGASRAANKINSGRDDKNLAAAAISISGRKKTVASVNEARE